MISVKKYKPGETGAAKSFAYTIDTYQMQVAITNASFLGVQTLTVNW